MDAVLLLPRKRQVYNDIGIKAERVLVREEEMLTEISKRVSSWPQLHVLE